MSEIEMEQWECVRRAHIATIVAASELVAPARARISQARHEVDRLERLLVVARDIEQAAIRDRDAATQDVRELVDEFSTIGTAQEDA